MENSYGTKIYESRILQSFGSQLWDSGFALQALVASNLANEIPDVLRRGYDFFKNSQVRYPLQYDFVTLTYQNKWRCLTELRFLKVRENPSGDFTNMYRHMSKGSWTFSDRDHGWQASDCTAEGFKVISQNSITITSWSAFHLISTLILVCSVACCFRWCHLTLLARKWIPNSYMSLLLSYCLYRWPLYHTLYRTHFLNF